MWIFSKINLFLCIWASSHKQPFKVLIFKNSGFCVSVCTCKMEGFRNNDVTALSVLCSHLDWNMFNHRGCVDWFFYFCKWRSLVWWYGNKHCVITVSSQLSAPWGDSGDLLVLLRRLVGSHPSIKLLYDSIRSSQFLLDPELIHLWINSIRLLRRGQSIAKQQLWIHITAGVIKVTEAKWNSAIIKL